MPGRSVEVVETLHRRKVDVQETRWTGSGARIMGKGMSRYKFFWQGCKDGNAGVEFLISDRWIDMIVDVKRVNERIMYLKVLIGNKVVTCICEYVPQTGRSAESTRGKPSPTSDGLPYQIWQLSNSMFICEEGFPQKEKLGLLKHCQKLQI